MKPVEACRSFAENRGELLARLGELLAPAGGSLRLVDPARQVIWTSTGGHDSPPREGNASPPAGMPGIGEIPLGAFGALQIVPPASSASSGTTGRAGPSPAVPGAGLPHPPPGPDWAAAVGELLVGGLEAESEFDHLADDHIATTNQLVALYQIINRTRDTWELPAKMEAIVAEAARQTAAGQATLLLEDPRWPLRIDRGPEGESRRQADELLQGMHNDNRPRIDPEGRYVIAPIRGREGQRGSLLVTDPPSGGYKARDLKLVQALSELATGFLSTACLQEQVISNLRLEQEIEIASHIQALLLARQMPLCPGLELTAACRPAFHVGGDFYLAERAADGSLLFTFGDVAGKGVPAALFMAMTRTVLMALGREQHDPMMILRRVNEVLYQDLEQAGKFVTLVVGRIDVGRGTLELANAGHSPVIVLPGGGAAPILPAPGLPPLGVVPEFEDGAVMFSFGPDSLLAVMSDGLSEARSTAGEFYGTDRLQRLLQAGALDPVTALAERVFADVAQFSTGAQQADDQTLLLVQRKETV